jgi:hypothetical protein
MAITLMQKIRLWWRGAGRRREERDRDFLAKNVSWGPAGATAPVPQTQRTPAKDTMRPEAVDRDGLLSAYLDQSGQIAYYLDMESGEVIEVRDGSSLTAPRYRRVPMQSDDEDRSAFILTLDDAARDSVAAASSFRAWLATNRTLERAYYNFKVRRATEAIEKWLQSPGI